jgi:hypothetical protein
MLAFMVSRAVTSPSEIEPSSITHLMLCFGLTINLTL